MQHDQGRPSEGQSSSLVCAEQLLHKVPYAVSCTPRVSPFVPTLHRLHSKVVIDKVRDTSAICD